MKSSSKAKGKTASLEGSCYGPATSFYPSVSLDSFDHDCRHNVCVELPRENALELDRSQTGAEADDAQILFSSTSPVSLSLCRPPRQAHSHPMLLSAYE
jgi:hypothetical protein